MQDIASSKLSDITVFNKYAKFLSEVSRRENYHEITDRNKEMHQLKYPQIAERIERIYQDYVHTKKTLPSMRSMQFGGRPILLAENRIYNCAYAPIELTKFFSELMFLLLGGTGMGYSVQRRHVNQLHKVKTPESDLEYKFQIQDSIIGWADSIKVVLKAFLKGGTLPVFDYRDIREKGTDLVTTGGKAPGPEPLRKCINTIIPILRQAIGRKLTPLECHDISCIIADSVRAGGIRRAAMIALFDRDDEEMLNCKSLVDVQDWWSEESDEAANNVKVFWVDRYGIEGQAQLENFQWRELLVTNQLPWYLVHPYRARANNSAVLPRGKVSEEEFRTLLKVVEASGCGEPGIYWTNNEDWGTNPCCLAGDAQILTRMGYVPISTLDDGRAHDFVNVAGEVVQGTVWRTGEKQVLRIKAGMTKEPIQIRATADHRFMTAEGDTVEAKDLKGKHLMPFYAMKEITPNLAIKYGFTFGDGSFRKDHTLFKNVQVSFTPGKDDEVKALFTKTGWSDNTTSFTVDVAYEELAAFGVDTTRRTYDRQLPILDNLEEIQDFLTGMYSANGSVIKGSRVAYKTTSKDVAEGLLGWLKRIGIHTAYITTNKPTKIAWSNGDYISKESYDVNICRLKDVILFAKTVSFVQSYKQQALETLIQSKAPYVFSVSEEGIEPVYDFTLQDDTHWGVVEGVIAHNCEIGLRPYQMCNLTTINVSSIKNQEDFNLAAGAAAFLGTLQAGYTDFHYLNPKWKIACEKEALLGVSMTGIASGNIDNLDAEEAAQYAKDINEQLAAELGINSAARVTAVKPEGTSSLVLGTSSGIHAWHGEYYIRRMRAGKDEALAQYLMRAVPELVEEDVTDSNQVVLSFPQKAPEGAVLRHESMMELLDRVRNVSESWVRAGHRSGDNHHNVSCTISVKDDEWASLTDWMWDHRDVYNGISVMPFFGSTAYPQMPFEDISKEQYEAMLPLLERIDISYVKETDGSAIDLAAEAACAGGVCEIL